MNSSAFCCYTEEEAKNVLILFLKFINREYKFNSADSSFVEDIYLQRLPVIINHDNLFVNGYTMCVRFVNGQVRPIEDFACHNSIDYPLATHSYDTGLVSEMRLTAEEKKK